MSLQVWLPLTGDLHNQGLNPIISTSTAYTIENAGKIGKCIKCTNAHFNTGITAENWDFTTTSISFGGWVKINKTELEARTTSTTYDSTYTSAGGTLMGYNSYGGLGLRWRTNDIYSTGSLSTVILYAHIRNNSSGIVSTSAYTLPFNDWVHVLVIFNREKQTLGLYINGVLFNEKACSTATYATSGNIIQNTFLFNQATWDGGSGRSLNVPWQINDFRLYDHALSAKEVEEIAKGLVLHYKLDYSNPNLLSKYVTPGQAAPGGTATAGRTNYYEDYGIVIPATENADTYFRLFLKQQLTQNTVYTISCYVSGLLPGSSYNFPLFAQSNASMGVLSLNHNGLCSLTFTMNSSTQTSITAPDGSTVYICFMDDSARTLASGQGAITVTGFKLEQGNVATPFNTGNTSVIYDSSGYNNNGTISGTLTAAADSPRYDVATYISSGDTNYITTPTMYLPGDQITMNFWFKSANKTPGSDYHTPLEGTANSNQAYEMSIYKTGILRGGLVVNGTRKVENCTSTKLTDGTWHMCTMTYDGTTIKRYVDAVMEKSTTVTGTLATSTQFVLGYLGSSTSYYCKETNISDVRIYTTALTDNQVKELYNTSMSVDSNGNVYARELVETI